MLIKTMKDGEKIKSQLLRIGYYISPWGGAPSPSTIRPRELLFEMITQGRVKHPEQDTWCGSGWIFFHRPGQQTVFQSKADEHYECMTALFRLKDHMDAWPRAFCWHDARAAEDFSREMLYAFHHEGIALPLLGELIWAQFRLRLAQDQLRQRDVQISPRVSAVMETITRQPEAVHTMASLAESVGMSASHLHAEFKAATGQTPHQLLIEKRLSAARHRLVTTMDPVKAIAFDVGYSNTEIFCRAFKKNTGLTAAAFRKKYMLYD